MIESTESAVRNKRIAKNTLFLYIRMLFSMIISLYTSRIVLEKLGIEDYGIYNIVGGIVFMLAFFTSSLSNATQRFLSIELGKKKLDGAKLIFNQSLLLYVCLIVVLILVSETLGVWFIKEKLIIPFYRKEAAIFVFHFSLLSMMATIIQVPYVSVVIAREQLSVYAYLGIIEAVAKLVAALILTVIITDKLIFYAVLVAGIHVMITAIYIFYCHHNYYECQCQFYGDLQTAKKILSFVSLNLFGCFSYSFGMQGINIVLNLFFGPTLNAARGVALQVSSALSQISGNMITAVKPQIIKLYASNDLPYMIKLLEYSSVYSCILMLLFCLPILYNIDFILHLWLKEVPPYTSIFVQLLIVESLWNTLTTPLWYIANATGNIKRSQVYGRCFIASSCLVAYFLFKSELASSPVVVFVITLLAQIGYWAYSVYDIHLQISLDIRYYFKMIVKPIFFSSSCSNISKFSAFIVYIE